MSSRPSAFSLTSPGPLRLYSTAELLRLPPPTWLIHTILPSEALVGLYGPPGEAKSFLAIDLALAVATGGPWQGHAVRQGFVVYVSAEGGTGIAKRVNAWLDTHRASPASARIGWLIEALPIHADSSQLTLLLDRLHEEIEDRPVLIIVDTLARCFNGDENTQLDMGRFIQGIDRLRRECRATILVVHHTRLRGDRERGNTALRGAADTMIAIKKQRCLLTLTCTKQKEAEEFPETHLRLLVSPPHDSCVVGPLPETHEKAILAWLSEPRTYAQLLGSLKAHMGASTLKRKLVGLQQKREITKENGIYRRTRPTQVHPVGP